MGIEVAWVGARARRDAMVSLAFLPSTQALLCIRLGNKLGNINNLFILFSVRLDGSFRPASRRPYRMHVAFFVRRLCCFGGIVRLKEIPTKKKMRDKDHLALLTALSFIRQWCPGHTECVDISSRGGKLRAEQI